MKSFTFLAFTFFGVGSANSQLVLNEANISTPIYSQRILKDTNFFLNTGRIFSINEVKDTSHEFPLTGSNSQWMIGIISGGIRLYTVDSNLTSYFPASLDVHLGDIEKINKIFESSLSISANDMNSQDCIKGLMSNWSTFISPSSSENFFGANKDKRFFDLRNATLLSATPTNNSEDDFVENELDVSRQVFFRNDGSKWLEQRSEKSNLASFFLNTVSANGDTYSFGITSTNQTATVGWLNKESAQLVFSTSSISTRGSFYSNEVMGAAKSIFVSENSIISYNLPENILAYFASSSTQPTLMLESTSEEDDVSTMILLKQKAITGLISTSIDNGLLFNSIAKEARENELAVTFAVNSEIVGGFSQDGVFYIGSNYFPTSAAFIVNSHNKGVLLARMSSKERRSIRNPIEGLEVYDTDLHKKCVYTNRGWEAINSKLIDL